MILDTAKYLHGGRLIDSNKDYSLTFNMLSSILKLKKDNVNSLDLEYYKNIKSDGWLNLD